MVLAFFSTVHFTTWCHCEPPMLFRWRGNLLSAGKIPLNRGLLHRRTARNDTCTVEKSFFYSRNLPIGVIRVEKSIFPAYAQIFLSGQRGQSGLRAAQISRPRRMMFRCAAEYASGGKSASRCECACSTVIPSGRRPRRPVTR